MFDDHLGGDPNEAAADQHEPEPLETAKALEALCELLSTDIGFQFGFCPSERPSGFTYAPWENDIAINFEGSEFILSLRPSNYIKGI